MTDDELLDFPQKFHDVKAKSLREYFQALLLTLWYEGECFSGKRPFGNSYWESDIYLVLVKTGAVKGDLNEDGYLDDCDYPKANKLVERLIKHIFKGGAK